MMCDGGCHYCEKPNKMNLKDLEKKYEELGKEIEALKEAPISLSVHKGLTSEYRIHMRTDGSYTDLCIDIDEGSFKLDMDFDWELRDIDGVKILTPTKQR